MTKIDSHYLLVVVLLFVVFESTSSTVYPLAYSGFITIPLLGLLPGHLSKFHGPSYYIVMTSK